MALTSACANHPPLTGSGDGSGGADDAGTDARPGRPDGGRDAGSIDAPIDVLVDSGVDAGPAPVCQVRYPVAVLFYDCVDMAPPGGGTPTRVCLSDEKFGGDAEAARHYVRRALEITREMYVRSCAPLAADFTLFTPSRVLNARIGTPENEFGTWGGAYLYREDLSRLIPDILTDSDNPYRFGAYVVYNGWRSSILPSYYPATHFMAERPQPPYAIFAMNLDEGIDPAVPANLKVALRHELDHTLESVASVNHFTRHIPTHEEGSDCHHGFDDHRICQLFNGVDGAPLTVADWQSALGPLADPVTCDLPERVEHCGSVPTSTCGTTDCPPLPGYSPSCNAQGYCEYEPLAPVGAWRVYDRWIYVPPGLSFTMGHNDPAHPEEGPSRLLTLGAGYFFSKYEIPVEAYEACEADGACPPRVINHWDGGGWGVNTAAARPLHPANAANFYAAIQLCEWLYPGARPPSEAEWEFAARGSSSLVYPFGAGPASCDAGLAVFNATGSASGYGCGTGGTWPVNAMSGGISPIGAFHMAGNVWEWIEDPWHVDYTGAPSDTYPWWPGGVHDFYRTIRGGGYNDATDALRGSRRSSFFHTFVNANIGVRCVVSADRVYPENSLP